MTAKFVSKKDVFCTSGTIRSIYEKRKSWVKTDKTHFMKSVCIRSYSGPHFPAFGLNADRYRGDQDLVPAPFHLINFCQRCTNSLSMFHIFFDIKAPFCVWLGLGTQPGVKAYGDISFKIKKHKVTNTGWL